MRKSPSLVKPKGRFRCWWSDDWIGVLYYGGLIFCLIAVMIAFPMKSHFAGGKVVGKGHTIPYTTRETKLVGKTRKRYMKMHPETWTITVLNGNSTETWNLSRSEWDAITEGQDVTWEETHDEQTD